MTRKNIAVMTILAITFIVGTPLAQARQDKVTICHVSGGDPVKYTTNTVSASSLLKHLDHGDLLGACDSQAATLCDDGNLCTVDVLDPFTGTCDNSQPVNCDDGIACTDNLIENCEPTTGCVATVNCADPTAPVCDPDTGLCVGETGDNPLALLIAESGWDSAELYQTDCATNAMRTTYTESSTPEGVQQVILEYTIEPDETETKVYVRTCVETCTREPGSNVWKCERKCELKLVATFPDAKSDLSNLPFKAPNEASLCVLDQCVDPTPPPGALNFLCVPAGGFAPPQGGDKQGNCGQAWDWDHLSTALTH